MPRKQYKQDLSSAIEGTFVVGISNVQEGGDDGEFTFECVADGEKFKISALIPGLTTNILTDLSDYPSCHTFMIFAPDDAPASVAGALSNISEAATGKTLIQLLERVSRQLKSTDRDGNSQMIDSQDYDGLEDGDDDEDDDDVDEYFPDDDLVPHSVNNSAYIEGYTKAIPAYRQRIRSDLMIVKANGFKVGHLGGLMDGLACHVSLSCRISKLGISEEAMQAWQVEPTEYLVVIFHFPNGYKSIDSMKSYNVATARRNFGVRVGISTTYKPTQNEAFHAFATSNREDEMRRDESQEESHTMIRKGFRNSFISRPLNELLEERFHTLLHYRYNGMSWSGAEDFYNDHIATNHAHVDLGLKDKYLEIEQVNTAYPALVTSDHIQESVNQEHSLPLVGMQFVLRHFVRCCEFCLICFTKMPDDLQAIKPYVCDKPLCLYQYMSLGFGPSIEHEILSQPKVVDLLVSFCYTSARTGRLKDFPAGLGLMVPPNMAYETDHFIFETQQSATDCGAVPTDDTLKEQKVRFNAVTHEILFFNKNDKCPLRAGEWIVIRTDDTVAKYLHFRVSDTSCFPSIRLTMPVKPAVPGVPVEPQYGSSGRKDTKPPPPPPVDGKEASVNEFRSASLFVYSQNFDDLPAPLKRMAVCGMLDILPSVAEMKQYLTRKAQSVLGSWVDRLPPAALGILRWIIASNRACILQVDEADQSNPGWKGADRLYGMPGWSQFRFAMGAPDKERRFVRAVRETTDRLKLRHSTLFAWHGSPLVNWHGIIREGLHFNHTANGRAFGHGVYHSLDLNTSIGYSGLISIDCIWPTSELKVATALALNEIVNAPREYVSSNPHLVVAQLDWIQTRYLFVKENIDTSSSAVVKETAVIKETKPLQSIEQDPIMCPKGPFDKLIIPIHAIAGSRRPQSRAINDVTRNKRQKASGTSVYDVIDLEEDDVDNASVSTLDEDLVIFYEEGVQVPEPDSDPLPTPNSIPKGKSKVSGFFSKIGSSSKSTNFLKLAPKPFTDYLPGTLDYSTLPMIQQPAWATPVATRHLMRDFKELLKVQDKEPSHTLGWHIDRERVDNMYQWIVELHSFDSNLPLAQDMKAKGHKSIVLELRFGKDYPMSPPFVRVVRPRFLSFQQGGGGHVTAGGALCMELLTNDGWSAVSSIESVLLQVRVAISSLDPRPARLAMGGSVDYGVGEAVEAYIRACVTHGWKVPSGFKEMAYGGSADNF